MADLDTGVVGAGLMGADVSALLANAGFDVVLVDVDPDALDRARERHATDALDALDAAGLRQRDALVPNVTYATDVDALADCDFVVEAVPERLDLKRSVVADLDAVLDADAVVGTNTSSLTPSDVAVDAEAPERVVFFHFPNPAIERDVVEVGGEQATDRAVERAVAVGEAMGKWVAELDGEARAHCLSRVSAAIKCAGTWELREAEPAAIDRAATDLGFPRGPLEFVDLIGLDVHLRTVENLREPYGGRFDPPPEVRERMEAMVDRGDLGKKSGRGFYEWDGDDPVVPDPDESHDVAPVVAAMVSEAHRIVADGITDRETLNDILRRGSGGDVGPFDALDLLGRELLVATLRERHDATGAGVYEPAPSLIEESD